MESLNETFPLKYKTRRRIIHRKKETPHTIRLSRSMGESIIFIHHVLKIIIITDRNLSIKIFSGKLVLEGNFSFTNGRELGNHGKELDVAVMGEDLGIAASNELHGNR